VVRVLTRALRGARPYTTAPRVEKRFAAISFFSMQIANISNQIPNQISTFSIKPLYFKSNRQMF